MRDDDPGCLYLKGDLVDLLRVDNGKLIVSMRDFLLHDEAFLSVEIKNP